MDEIRWNSYSSTGTQQVSPQEWQDTIDKRLSEFYLKNHPRFHKSSK
jgi:hypothetical protein